MSSKKKWFLMGLALLAAPAFAAQNKDPASGCAVIAPQYLSSSDYAFQYQGGCKAGLAEGQGKATWTLRGASGHPVVWQGAFSAGVYLPPPAGIVSAREWTRSHGSGDAVIFDMGPLPAQNGISAARLEVQASANLTHYPDPCAPHTLWVTHAPAAAMAADGAAQSLLRAAVDKLKARCGARLAEGTNMGSSGAGPRLRVRAVSTPGLESDRWGNPGPVVAEAQIPLVAGDAIQGYTNQAASQQRQQEQQTQDQTTRQANLQRLRAFFRTHQAQGWATLSDIAQNPFRYADRVVVTAAQVDAVVSPTRATLYARGNSDTWWWNGAFAVLDGAGIAQWQPGARLLAVRVTGRVKDDKSPFDNLARLQLVGSEACTQSRCEDWLHLPARLQDGQRP